MLNKIVHAGVASQSFELGSKDLAVLAEVEVSAKQVERVTKRIGLERQGERDENVRAYQALPLVQRKAVPETVDAQGQPQKVAAPDLAVVGVDGGRLQILERGEIGAKAATAEETVAAEDGKSGKHWREDKIGLLMTMTRRYTAGGAAFSASSLGGKWRI
jgi:hypothetical protein